MRGDCECHLLIPLIFESLRSMSSREHKFAPEHQIGHVETHSFRLVHGQDSAHCHHRQGEHTFDNYFGTFPNADGFQMPRSPNPPPRDPDHRHSVWLTREKTSVRQQFVQADLPAYFEYAKLFHTLRPLLHRSRRAIDPKPSHVDRSGLTLHRQPETRRPIKAQHLPTFESRKTAIDMGELRWLRFPVPERNPRDPKTRLGPIQNGRRQRQAAQRLMALRSQPVRRTSTGPAKSGSHWERNDRNAVDRRPSQRSYQRGPLDHFRGVHHLG